MTQDFATIGLPELFARLAAGAASRVTVVTPNQRLAQAVTARLDATSLAAGEASWEAPDVLSLGAFLARALDEARYADPAQSVPGLLTEAEAQILWEEAVRASDARVLSAATTATLAASAWELAHAWRIAGALDRPGNEDTDAFALWRRAYERRTMRGELIDVARLPAWLAAAVPSGRVPHPAALVLYAFELLTPAQRDLFEAFARAGVEVLRCEPPARRGRVRRVVCVSPREELAACARWARARLEAAGPGARPSIAVVVPDLSQRRAEVMRVFSRVLPGCFNVSLGEPLAQVPLVDAAIAGIDLAHGAIPFDRASRLLRSPFITGARTEMAERARLDAALRRMAPALVTLNKFRAWIPEAAARRRAPSCPRFCAALDAVIANARTHQGRAAPHEWARRFSATLDALGFPGDRPLDSQEYQALSRWRELLAALGALSTVASAWSSTEARARLRHLAGNAIFQPASGEAPVQVLGILESAGLDFDHLWVSGLTEEAWPLPARPHALIPPALQRQAGVPQASAESSLALDRSLTARWREAASEAIFSSARADGDRELLPSPLVADIAGEELPALALPDFEAVREALFAAGREPGAVATRSDGLAPALGDGGVQGGTALLGDQAACPFRAFAHYRLDARALERPESGLGPAERGQLLHLMMAGIWKELRNHSTLLATADARLEALAADAAAQAVSRVRTERPGRLEGRFAELERERLAALALAWLAIERERPPFEVRLREAPMTLTAGNLRFEGRVDRIDHLADGGLAIIDYKSGNVSVSSWLGDRPDDAQLPLYALAAGEDEVRAVAFAKLKTGQLGFAGLARDEGLLPGVGTVEKHRGARKFATSWAQLQAAWREEVDRLAENFASGDARIDPKRMLATCERCDLRTLCRVHERLGALALDGAPDSPEDDA